jgi:hypothetical protein
MNGMESNALEAAKSAMPFEEAERLAVDIAISAVKELRVFNQNYVTENKMLEDDFDYVPAGDTREDDPAVRRLSRVYLQLLHRRGLVGY